MSFSKAKKKNIRKILLILIIAIPAILIVRYWYDSTHPLSDPQYGFQYYKPTSLPSGFQIKEKRISVDNNQENEQIDGLQVELNLRKEDWVYEITESRANSTSSPDSGNITTNLRNYDPNSVGVTCRQVNTPNGQSYRLCHWIDYGRISVYEVNLIKGQTYILTEFPGTLKKVVPVSTISNYVDSFVKAKATGFMILSGGI